MGPISVSTLACPSAGHKGRYCSVGRTPLEADGKLRDGVLIGTTKGARSGVIQPDAVARRGSPLDQRLENVDEAIGPTSEWKANASPAT